MDNLSRWDEIRTLTEGLVNVSGWVGVKNDEGVAAELFMQDGTDFEVSFVVTESHESVDLIVRLTIGLNEPVNPERFDESIRILSSLLLQRRMAIMLWKASLCDCDAIYEIGYSWRCDAELQQEVTLPVLCDTILRWSSQMSGPVISIAPLIGLYLRGIFKRDEDFLSAAMESLDFLSVKALGRA